MNYLVRCIKCGAEWWTRGTYESDVNALVFDDSVIHEGECECGIGVETVDEDPIDFDD